MLDKFCALLRELYFVVKCDINTCVCVLCYYSVQLKDQLTFFIDDKQLHFLSYTKLYFTNDLCVFAALLVLFNMNLKITSNIEGLSIKEFNTVIRTRNITVVCVQIINFINTKDNIQQFQQDLCNNVTRFW
jgi:hypothetical protein